MVRSRVGSGIAFGALVAGALAACGNAFTSATGDGGAPFGADGSSDDTDATGISDGNAGDGRTFDDAARKDGEAEGGAPAPDDDGGPAPVEASDDGAPSDAATCLRACPSGFNCILGKCEDRAVLHFSAATMTSNWSYGSFTSQGSTPFVAYIQTWNMNGLAFWSQTKNTVPLSVFHSAGATTFDGMSIPAGTLGLYPGTSSGQDSVVRWTAPVAGHYALDATFTGLGQMPVTMVGTDVNIGLVVQSGGGTINAFGGPNMVVYSNADVSLAAGDTVDFYVLFVTTADDLQGGTGLDARITAN